MRLRFFALVMVAVSLACKPHASEGLDRDTFVDVIAELRKAAREYPDSSTFDQHKADLLREKGVTDSALADFVRIHNPDTRYMAQVWEAVDRLVNPPAGTPADTTH